MLQGKIWGSTELLLCNPMIELHRIKIKPGMQCSTHKHEHKWNGFYCIQGAINIVVIKKDYNLIDTTRLQCGDFTAVKPGEFHHFETLKGVSAVVLEIYWLEGISEDIIRENCGGLIDVVV